MKKIRQGRDRRQQRQLEAAERQVQHTASLLNSAKVRQQSTDRFEGWKLPKVGRIKWQNYIGHKRRKAANGCALYSWML